MDSDFSYQPKYVWKTTALDGMLPITNFTEDIKQDEMRLK